MAEQVRGWIAAHAEIVVVLGAVALLAWLVVLVGGELLMWARARRHAARMWGCAMCAAPDVVAVAYPTRTGPVAYCSPCLDLMDVRWEAAEVEPPPMVDVRLDWLRLVGLSVGPLLIALPLVLLLADAAGSGSAGGG